MISKNLPLAQQLARWMLRKTSTGAVRRVARFSAALATDIGNVRDENQDRAIIAHGLDKNRNGYLVVAVADGMGGMQEGATCASSALANFIASIDYLAKAGVEDTAEWLDTAAKHANTSLHATHKGAGGATLVAIVKRSNLPTYWLSIGDSRIYLSQKGSLEQITTDDTIAGQLGKNSDLTSAQTKLLQFVGMGQDLEPHVSTFIGEGAALLTTDGMHFFSTDSTWMGKIIENSLDFGVCAKRLVDLSKWCGGHDNSTIAIVPSKPESYPTPNFDYNFLEVWDSFGELQIISETSPRFEQTEDLPDRHESPREQTRYKAQEDKNPTYNTKKNTPSTAPASAKDKKNRKNKQRPAKLESCHQEKKDDQEQPQLHMEFPAKGNSEPSKS
jgi:serine/threonine protein phosphatase PrpC